MLYELLMTLLKLSKTLSELNGEVFTGVNFSAVKTWRFIQSNITDTKEPELSPVVLFKKLGKDSVS